MGRTSTGICISCEKELSKMTVAKHLKNCPERSRDDGNERLFLISVQSRSPEYWLYLEASADSTLKQLDHFLRDIWLECCGHMSLFIIENQTFSSDPDQSYGDKSMRVKLRDLLYKGMSFRHEYDMGSTTELKLKVVEERLGANRAAPAIELLARNSAPVIYCDECGTAVAENVCSECQYDKSGWLCEACSEAHECGEEMLLPVVNSPRVGVCGYTG
ncbi:hypothetical protein [Cohnella sp. REN36]|uniref:hypothetical protein n=1 Tax=Cohnella sp. REN36 TaxID=2887347 RepID=UPI001D134B71|nr:hypothetical protein [Cohnella sp. REN36]MCC3377585.1 hypothetical protein [Cohnella sp. REN36]